MKSVFKPLNYSNDSNTSARKHYMTLCFMDNCEVTYKLNNGRIEVGFETAIDYGFKSMDMTLEGEIIFNSGYTSKEVEILRDFTLRNAKIIVAKERGDFD